MESLDKLKEEIRTLIDSVEDKGQVEQLGKLSGIIDDVEADTKALKDENKELLNSYKEVVKHVSFKVDGNGNKPGSPTGDELPKVEDFFNDDFLAKLNK